MNVLTEEIDAKIWTLVAHIEDIPPLGARVVEGAARGPVAVFRTQGDHVFALLDRCPHKGGPLSQGVVHGEQVTCPLHAWKIGLSDGEAVAPDKGCARRFSVRVEGDRVYLKTAELVARD